MKNSRPVIVINMSYQECAGRLSHVLFDLYCEPVWRAGGMPVFVPVIESFELMKYYLDTASGFLLIGGKDYPPELYGESPHPKTNMSRLKPRFDFEWAKLVLKSGRPVLGICGGCQIMAVAAGGRLIQHLENAETCHCNGVLHRAQMVKTGVAAELLGVRAGEDFTVNSFHHQAVDLAAPGAGFEITARAFDGTVEVIERPGRSMTLGVQFHPERMNELAPVFFNRLVSEASGSH